MRRDLNLIRKILLAIEEAPTGWAPDDLEFEGYTAAQVAYHSYLLIDAGLARGEDVSGSGSDGPEGLISNLTWEGHEFAEAARDEGRWRKVMGTVAAKGGSVTLDVLKALLISAMKGAFGLS